MASSAGLEQLYVAAVGENKADFYLPVFRRIDDGGSSASWNWPAFFVPTFWMLHRRMYGYAAALFFLFPIALVLFGAVAIVVLGEATGGFLYLGTYAVLRLAVVPIFANALFHHHLRRRIDRTLNESPSHDAAVQRLIGQSRSSAGLIIGVAVVGFVVMFGILAAISIPAYQDYTIRAQVTEGLTLAGPVKHALEQRLATRDWPEDIAALGIDPKNLQGKYVTEITTENGFINIRYGNAAHKKIAGGVISLIAKVGPDGHVTWTCGRRGAPGEPMIEQRLLPSACRPSR